MKIENNIIKSFLKNVRFITGTAYAGKSTMVRKLAKTYGLVACEENYHSEVIWEELDPLKQPNLCYLKHTKDWQEFLNRSPEVFAEWIIGIGREAAEIEVAELIRISQDQIVIVDTNIPLDILKEITDYHQVAVMLSPQSLSVEKFFDREDPEKQFIKEQIMKSENPEATMTNYKACLAKVNSKEEYNKYANSGFFTLVRRDESHHIVDENLEVLASHFKLKKSHLINNEIVVEKIEQLSPKWNQLITYATNCSWVAGKHLANMLEKNVFTEWESVFVAVDKEKIIGFCTFMRTDYYPENRYSPWISCIFVDEGYRGHRISGQMISEASKFAKGCGFKKVYIPSDMLGFYEQYGFVKIDELENYGGDIDYIFQKEL